MRLLHVVKPTADVVNGRWLKHRKDPALRSANAGGVSLLKRALVALAVTAVFFFVGGVIVGLWLGAMP